MDYIIKDGELYHHGILGQKWGVRRYQNADGSLTQAGKKRVSKKQSKALEKARKAKKKKADEVKKAKEVAEKEKQKQEEFEANKKKALESGSAADVMKYKGKLTNKELQDAFTRINLERQLSDIQAKETKTGFDKAEDFMNKVDRGRQMTEKGISAYNTAAKIINSTTKADLPIIDGTKKKDKLAEKKKEKLIKSGTPEEILNNFGKFTAKELEDINKRFNYEDNIKKRTLANRKQSELAKAIDDAHAKGRAADEANRRYEKQQEEANARFKAEREARAANKTTSSERYVAGLLESGNKGSTPVAGLLSAPNQRYIDSGSNYIAGFLPAPKDRD